MLFKSVARELSWKEKIMRKGSEVFALPPFSLSLFVCQHSIVIGIGTLSQPGPRLMALWHMGIKASVITTGNYFIGLVVPQELFDEKQWFQS